MIGKSLCHKSPFTIFALSAGFQHTKTNIGNTGNQNHPDLEVRVVLVTCISNIDYVEAGNQPIMQKWSIGTRELLCLCYKSKIMNHLSALDEVKRFFLCKSVPFSMYSHPVHLIPF